MMHDIWIDDMTYEMKSVYEITIWYLDVKMIEMERNDKC